MDYTLIVNDIIPVSHNHNYFEVSDTLENKIEK